MTKSILFVLVLLLPAITFAQRTDVAPVMQAVRVDRTVKTVDKSVPEIIFPESITQVCADSATVYGFNEPASGAVTGTNSYLETAKVQRFVYPTDSSYYITQIGVAFAVADTVIADRKVAVDLYNDLNADSTLGSYLATSDSVLVSDIILPDSFIRFTTFTFPEPVLVTRDSFLVFVDFTDIYNSATGDVAIFSTYSDCGSGTNTFTVYPIGSSLTDSLAFASFRDLYNLDVEMFMTATVDPALNTSTRSPLADYGVSVSPNPTSGSVVLNFRAEAGADYRVTVTDLSGRQLLQLPAQAGGGQGQARWQMSDYPSGLYLYHVDGPAGRQSGKLVVR